MLRIRRHPIQPDEVENIERLVNQGLNSWVEKGHAEPHAFNRRWEYDYAEGDTRVFHAFKTCQYPIETLEGIVDNCVEHKYLSAGWDVNFSGYTLINRPDQFDLQYHFDFRSFPNVVLTLKFKIDNRDTDNERAYTTIKLQGGPHWPARGPWPGQGPRPTDLA